MTALSNRRISSFLSPSRSAASRKNELLRTPNPVAFDPPNVVDETARAEPSSDPDKSDAQKVLEFVKQFPDVDQALKPIYDLANRLDHDQETQSLLRTIAQDERSTLEFLGEACALLNPS